LLCSQENLEECQTATEFLLEPWILVQLPFQPLLFHQWSVALLAEALKFEIELKELFYIPSHLKTPVGKLEKMCNLMFRAAFKFFDHFTSYFYKEEENLSSNVGSSFLDLLPEVLPVIEFVLSEDCRKIIKALTRIALSSTSVKYKRTEAQIESGDNFPCCYNIYYWKQESVLSSICSKDVMTSCFLKSHPWPDPKVVKERVEAIVETASEVEGLKNLIEEKLFNTGQIKGENKEFFFGMLDGINLKNLIYMYRNYVKISGWLNNL